MVEDNTPTSKRRLALGLCRRLLDDLDHERIKASTAVQRLHRIAQLLGDQKLVGRVLLELDGYPTIGATPRQLEAEIRKRIKGGGLAADTDVKKLVDANMRIQGLLPDYRKLSLVYHAATSYSAHRQFKAVQMDSPISKCEELLDTVRRDRKTVHILQVDNDDVVLNASELNKLVSGAIRWVYSQASRLAEVLEFGRIPADIIESTVAFVDSQLFDLVPEAAQRLVAAYRNLAERNQENWVNVPDTCRRVIKDFADVVFPPRDEKISDLELTDAKYLNRIRAFVAETVESRRVRQHLESVLALVGELLASTDNIASRSVHYGRISRFEAERVLLYTYLAIGDILVLSGYRTRPEASTKRVSLNKANYDDLQSELGLSPRVAAEIIKFRKTRDFESWDDLAAISGVGPKTLDRLRQLASL